MNPSGETRFVVMVSGNGSNLQALIDAIEKGEVKASIVLVVSSDPEAYALRRAEKAGIPFIVLRYSRDPKLEKEASRGAYDRMLAETIAPYRPDYIFLLGWMRVLSAEFTARFPGRIVNLHPALPGTFPGTHAIERAWEACARGEITDSGVMTHFVPDERVDAGPVIAFERVAIGGTESLDAFEKRMHKTEHLLVVRTAAMLGSISGESGKGV
ncbi:MAG TPA: phosphoribosylglycinamide formyltransferase [Rectinemataceae bacterium]|nr:phosphoribosylglycinamide formyltransferase [Rectinemataceae bacterium]